MAVFERSSEEKKPVPVPGNGAVAPARKYIDWGIGGWRNRAACRGSDPGLFFPVGSAAVTFDHMRAVDAVCRACTVQDACLQFALETNQQAGIWAGTTEDERRQMRRTWLAERRRPPDQRTVAS